MLQQTQVATVIGYYERFLTAFPDVATLAAAHEEDVLRLWEGLGYYRRARQLHRAARVIVEEHVGDFPRDAESVRRLPGIGRYTAGAILSIAFDQTEPILEANTIRLLARLLAYADDPTSTAAQQRLWAFSAALVPRHAAGMFNQALMELGATICTPRAPACDRCPVMSLCPTFARGLQTSIPATRRKPSAEAVTETALVIRGRGKQHSNRVLLVKRAAGRWAGLWDFPRYAADESALIATIKQEAGLTILLGETLTTLQHNVTRFRISLDCRRAVHVAGSLKESPTAEWRWTPLDTLRELPLSTTGRKIARLLIDH